MEITSNDNTVQPPLAAEQRPHTPAGPASEPFKQVLNRADAFAAAGRAVDTVVDKFIATAFFYPMLQQMNKSPFKIEMFDGGFPEQAFRSRLNLHLADGIASGSNLSVTEVLTGRLMDWLKNQPDSKLQEIAQTKGFDTIG